MASKAEAKLRAGELLKVTPIGVALEEPVSTRLGEAYDEVYARLQILGLAIWASSAEMPDEITPHFVALMAHNKMDALGTSAARYQRILIKVGDNGEKAIDNIRELVYQTFVDESEPEDY